MVDLRIHKTTEQSANKENQRRRDTEFILKSRSSNSSQKRCISYQVAKIIKAKKSRTKTICTETNKNIQYKKLLMHHLVTDFFLIYSRITRKILKNPILLHDQRFLASDGF